MGQCVMEYAMFAQQVNMDTDTDTVDTEPAEPVSDQKTCMRCKSTLPDTQTNFPHGSTWCTTCTPDSDPYDSD